MPILALAPASCSSFKPLISVYDLNRRITILNPIKEKPYSSNENGFFVAEARA